MAAFNGFDASNTSASAMFNEMIKSIGIEALMRLGGKAQTRLREDYSRMSSADRALYHQRSAGL